MTVPAMPATGRSLRPAGDACAELVLPGTVTLGLQCATSSQRYGHVPG